MENDDPGFTIAPFPHQILDEEAAKISRLILAVQERCCHGGERAALDLFQWAEECRSGGYQPEAEFLYLHSINICERSGNGKTRQYPVTFIGLREYALDLLQLIEPADTAASAVPALVPPPVSPLEAAA
jgi:hypothetical protein